MTVLRRGERGFTLLEVIVAMALFAAGIVAISRLFTGSLRLSGGARDASAGVIYARQRMEEALLVPNPLEGAEQGTFGDNYRWEVSTSFIPQEVETPYDEILLRVTVRWDDGGDERAVDLSATRWRWKERGEGSFSAGSDQMSPATVAGRGGIPGAGDGGGPMAGSGGDQGDYLGAFVRRRLR